LLEKVANRRFCFLLVSIRCQYSTFRENPVHHAQYQSPLPTPAQSSVHDDLSSYSSTYFFATFPHLHSKRMIFFLKVLVLRCQYSTFRENPVQRVKSPPLRPKLGRCDRQTQVRAPGTECGKTVLAAAAAAAAAAALRCAPLSCYCHIRACGKTVSSSRSGSGSTTLRLFGEGETQSAV
jgi:hypothetical protein